jgi:hypothetical protein
MHVVLEVGADMDRRAMPWIGNAWCVAQHFVTGDRDVTGMGAWHDED